MEIKKINILLINILGLFLIYGNLFRYNIGTILEINNSHIKTLGGVSTDPRWYMILFVIICYIIFIKNASFITSLIYKNNYFFEFNKKNQNIILKILFISFGLYFLFTKIIYFSKNNNFENLKNYPQLYLGIILIIFSPFIIKHSIKLVNNSEKHITKKFIFLVMCLIFYFIFFRDYNIRFEFHSKYIITLFTHIFVLLIIILSPQVFKFLIKNEEEISIIRFTYISFFWILFLYNLQEFLLNSLQDEHYSLNDKYLYRYVIFEIIFPIIFLLLNRKADKIKSISILKFSLYVIGFSMIFSTIYTLYLGFIKDTYFYLVLGILICFFTYKFNFYDRFLKEFKLTEFNQKNEPSKTDSVYFIFIIILVFIFSYNVFVNKNLFIHWVNLYDIISIIIYELFLLFGIIVLAKIASLKNLELSNTNTIVNLILLITISLLIFEINLFIPVFSKGFGYNSFEFTKDFSSIFQIGILIFLFIFSNKITKLISFILPKISQKNIDNK